MLSDELGTDSVPTVYNVLPPIEKGARHSRCAVHHQVRPTRSARMPGISASASGRREGRTAGGPDAAFRGIDGWKASLDEQIELLGYCSPDGDELSEAKLHRTAAIDFFTDQATDMSTCCASATRRCSSTRTIRGAPPAATVLSSCTPHASTPGSQIRVLL